MPNARTAHHDQPAGCGAGLVPRDLRAHDHAALYHARARAPGVVRFVFDRDILDPLLRGLAPTGASSSSTKPGAAGRRAGRARRTPWPRGRLLVRHGHAVAEIDRGWRASCTCRPSSPTTTTSPAALQRDARCATPAGAPASRCTPSKDHVVFERSEVLTRRARPGVFTPHKNAWLKKLEPFFLEAYPVEELPRRRWRRAGRSRRTMPTLESLGFQRTNLHELKAPTGGLAGARTLLDDFLAASTALRPHARLPGRQGPSYLSVHLRFGTCRSAHAGARGGARMPGPAAKARGVWLSELMWARLLPPDPAPPSARRGPRLQARIRRAALGSTASMPSSFRRLVRGPHRLPAGRRGDAPARADRLHAQPPAHGGGELPDQGSRHRLAARRAALSPTT